jgi:glycosyltransferase involved in cell wall biosynthesis
MVSIIIPYFNRPKKIIRCLESVLSQSFQDFEILIIDDYSKLALDLNIEDTRIKVYRNNKNLGPGLSRNVGLNNAQGEYVAFLDSDDYWHQNFLEITVKYLKKDNSLAFVYTNANSFKGTKQKLFRENLKPVDIIMPDILFNKRAWVTPSCLWNAKKINSVRFINTRNWEDYVFDIEVSINCNNIKYIDQVLCFCDSSGNDKLSSAKFSYKLKNKILSLNELFEILQTTKYANYESVNIYFTSEYLSLLAKIKSNEYFGSLDEIILKNIRIKEGFRFYLFLGLSYKILPSNLFSKLVYRMKSNKKKKISECVDF